MKIELHEYKISLIPENFPDQMYIAKIGRDKYARKNFDKETFRIGFSYSPNRIAENCPKGGGDLNIKNLVETLDQAEDGDQLVAVEEIDEFEIWFRD